MWAAARVLSRERQGEAPPPKRALKMPGRPEEQSQGSGGLLTGPRLFLERYGLWNHKVRLGLLQEDRLAEVQRVPTS